MNRRQFLTGTSAIAVSAALPVPPVEMRFTSYGAPSMPLDIESFLKLCGMEVQPWQLRVIKELWETPEPARTAMHYGKAYWITGEDNVIHWLDPRDVEIAE